LQLQCVVERIQKVDGCLFTYREVTAFSRYCVKSLPFELTGPHRP